MRSAPTVGVIDLPPPAVPDEGGQGERLLAQLRALPPLLMRYVGVVIIDEPPPDAHNATARLSVSSYSSRRYDFDPAMTGDYVIDGCAKVVGASLPGTNGAALAAAGIGYEPPINLAITSRHPDVILRIPASDLWAQCVEVVRSDVLGTAEAEEHTVTAPPERAGERNYVISGRGLPRTPERRQWIGNCVRWDAESEPEPPRSIQSAGGLARAKSMSKSARRASARKAARARWSK